MMHELAHCTQMNHSRAFWAVRNKYADDLRGLWDKSYTGDGFWGRGQRLYDGQYSLDAMPASDYMPENLCGGTYRSSRGRKRKRNEKESTKLSYAERKQRRLAKKFGKDWETAGRVLGEDEVLRYGLEKGKRVTGNPRVAKSKRGRELRAAAALARFDQANEEKLKAQTPAQSDADDTSETEDESDADSVDVKDEAKGSDGSRLLDSKGRGMVKVCGDEDSRDQDAQQELKELGDIRNYLDKDASATLNDETKQKRNRSPMSRDSPNAKLAKATTTTKTSSSRVEQEQPVAAPPQEPPPDGGDSTTEDEDSDIASREFTYYSHEATVMDETRKEALPSPPASPAKHPQPSILNTNTKTLRLRPPTDVSAPIAEQMCAACSFSNTSDALICAVCAHVLDLERLPRYWRCQSDACKGGMYVNSEDAGICGLCGTSKPLS